MPKKGNPQDPPLRDEIAEETPETPAEEAPTQDEVINPVAEENATDYFEHVGANQPVVLLELVYGVRSIPVPLTDLTDYIGQSVAYMMNDGVGAPADSKFFIDGQEVPGNTEVSVELLQASKQITAMKTHGSKG